MDTELANNTLLSVHLRGFQCFATALYPILLFSGVLEAEAYSGLSLC